MEHIILFLSTVACDGLKKFKLTGVAENEN